MRSCRDWAARAVAHGVAITDGDRYAFISMESRSAGPGHVDVIDVCCHARGSSVPVGAQTSGIDIWRGVRRAARDEGTPVERLPDTRQRRSP